MAGTVRCNKCHRAMSKPVCGKCGNVKCYVRVYWNGKNRDYGRDFEGDVLTYGKAAKLLGFLQTEIDKGNNPIDYIQARVQERKFESQIEIWIAEKEETRSPEYSRVLRSYQRKWFGRLDGYDVRDIDLEILSKFSRTIKTKSKTRKNIMDALRAFFHDLHRNGIIKTIPYFPIIEVDDEDIKRSIDYDLQAQALKRIPEAHRDIFEFGMETGIRPGETCALKVKDINWRQGIAVIQRTFSGAHLREKTKNKSKKPIPLSDRALEILGVHCEGKLPDAFVFTNPATGKHYTRHTLGDYWNRYSGLDVTHYEATRHSFGTQLDEAGVPIHDIQTCMRHASLKMTEKYLHKSVSKLRHFVNQRSKVIPLRLERDLNEFRKGNTQGNQ